MSLSYKEKLLCPLCGEESEFTHWQSINTAQDPELKRAETHTASAAAEKRSGWDSNPRAGCPTN